MAIVLLPIGASVRGDELRLKVGDAYVAAADDGRGWTIGNPFIRYSLGIDGGEVGVREIYDPVSDRDWRRSSLTGADSSMGVNGQRVVIGASTTPFQRIGVREWWGCVREGAAASV